MTSDPPPPPPPDPDAPRLNDEGQRRVAERKARQAEALRANLRRRKDQQRAREDDGGGEAT